MPYKNKCNKEIAEQVRFLSQNHVNREKEINDFSTSYEIPSQVESAVVRHPEVHGGNGFAAATVGAYALRANARRHVLRTVNSN